VHLSKIYIIRRECIFQKNIIRRERARASTLGRTLPKEIVLTWVPTPFLKWTSELLRLSERKTWLWSTSVFCACTNINQVSWQLYITNAKNNSPNSTDHVSHGHTYMCQDLPMTLKQDIVHLLADLHPSDHSTNSLPFHHSKRAKFISYNDIAASP